MFSRLPYSRKPLSYREISPTTLLVFTTLFLFCSYALVCRLYDRVTEDDSFDLLIFTQNWPNSVCTKWEKEGQNHTCVDFPQNIWTIHGLWPTKLGTIGPGFCNISHNFNPQSIYGIEDELYQVWAPVEKHKKKYAFWAHEWNKHGTCASVIPELSTEFDYFFQSIQLIKQYNMSSVLQQVGVTPGQLYNITQIWDGVKQVLGKNPQVVCFDEKGDTSVLIEIRICLSKTLELIDCNGTVVGDASVLSSFRGGYQNLSNCQIERSVRYPEGESLPTTISKHSQRMLQFSPTHNTRRAILEKIKVLSLAQWFTW